MQGLPGPHGVVCVALKSVQWHSHIFLRFCSCAPQILIATLMRCCTPRFEPLPPPLMDQLRLRAAHQISPDWVAGPTGLASGPNCSGKHWYLAPWDPVPCPRGMDSRAHHLCSKGSCECHVRTVASLKEIGFSTLCNYILVDMP